MLQATAFAPFQDEFVRALLDPLQPAPPAFAVYRNTVMKGCIDALRANFPAVARLVGEEWFRAAAAVYTRAQPPRVPMLLEYGRDFDAFLAGFEPAAELPYLPAVARLDRLWTEAHAAADEPALDALALAGLAPERLAALRLRPHAAARWAWHDLPAYTIWSRNRAGGEDAAEIEWQGEGALIVRPGDAVQWQPLDAAGCAFLDACARGEPLAQAAASVPAAGVAALLASLLEAGAFSSQIR
ncbi:MAG: DNA-binding domain-containing protein [Burkholderiales bacterium]